MASAITLDHGKIFSYEATIPEIFGQDAKPGRELLETIISTYKATRLLSVSQCTCLGGVEAKGSQICLFEKSWHRCKEDHRLID